jgi:hypothetical protein
MKPKDTEVVKLGERKEPIACLEKKSEKGNQVLILWKSDDGKRIIKRIIDNLGKYHFDEFVPGQAQAFADSILNISDAVMKI